MTSSRKRALLSGHSMLSLLLPVFLIMAVLPAGAETLPSAPDNAGSGNAPETAEAPAPESGTGDEDPQEPAEEIPAAAGDKEAAKKEITAEFHSEAIIPSLVIIEVGTKAGTAFGSGFVLTMGEKKYLITNQHVLDSFDSIEISTMSSRQIKPISFEICPTLDLVRMEITNDLPALVLADKVASIGVPIAVYGNSEGGGVATEIKGEVLGVGPDLIEVDAEFVQGNSGCPIVDDSGAVLGVASFATLFEDPENWLSKETRFQKVRRYGIRLDTCSWKSMNPRAFSQQSKFISDAETAILDYVAIIDFFANQDGFQGYIQDGGRVTYSPDVTAYHMKSFYKGSEEYYKTACSMLRSYIDSIKRGRDENSSGRILRNLGRESIKHLQDIQESLDKQRYASEYLKTRAEELGEVCTYCITEHW